MSERDDEFYTGYLPKAPAGIADWTRKMVALLFLVAAALLGVFVPARRASRVEPVVALHHE